jgi:hypothetical protein
MPRLDFKKIALIAGFFALCILFGFIIYKLFFASSISPAVVPDGQKTANNGILPSAGQGEKNPPAGEEGGELQLLENKQAQNAAEEQKIQEEGAIAKDLGGATAKKISPAQGGSGVNYYDSGDGKFYKVDEEGNIISLSQKVFHNVENISWARQGDKAVLEYPDGSNIVYDFPKDKQYTLPKHWQDFDFSPDGSQIGAKSIGLDPANRWITVSNFDGSKARAITDLGENEDKVITGWSPNMQSVALYEEGVAMEREKVYFVGLNNENFKALTVEGRGFEPLYNPKGTYLLYSAYSTASDLKPTLWSTRADGENIGAERKKLNIDTWAHKCVFTSESEAICAIPDALEKGAGMFPEMSKGVRDSIFRVNIQSGSKEEITMPASANYSFSNLTVNTAGNTLFFTNEMTGKIMKIGI